MIKVWVILGFIMQSVSAWSGEICGRIIQGSKHAQMIPLQGKTLTALAKDEILGWGSMVITAKEPVWVELSDQTQIKIAPESFFEFSKPSVQKHKLYRGSVFVSAPPTIKGFELITPNSVVDFHGGVMVVHYQPQNRETVLANFNRKVGFRNRFHEEAEITLNAGEISKLWIGNSNLLPKPAELLNPDSIQVALSGFQIQKEEILELIAVVKRVSESREKTLVADLESWIDLDQQMHSRQDRSIASFSKKGKKEDSSIDPKEAEWALGLLKKRLYGDAYGESNDSELKSESRKPASEKAMIQDPEYVRKKQQLKEQLRRVYEDIRNFDPESD